MEFGETFAGRTMERNALYVGPSSSLYKATTTEGKDEYLEILDPSLVQEFADLAVKAFGKNRGLTVECVDYRYFVVYAEDPGLQGLAPDLRPELEKASE